MDEPHAQGSARPGSTDQDDPVAELAISATRLRKPLRRSRNLLDAAIFVVSPRPRPRRRGRRPLRGSPDVGLSVLPSAAALLRAGGRQLAAVPRSPTPVVVADPDRTLPEARAEGREVALRLGATAIIGDDATRAAVFAAVAGAHHFYFSGHGKTDERSAWDTHLVLAGGARLSIADVLTHAKVTGVVVLNAGGSGVARAIGKRTSVSLPDAFLARGARTVIATSRSVDDGEARVVLRRWIAARGLERPAEALRQVALQRFREGKADWDSMIAFGRRD